MRTYRSLRYLGAVALAGAAAASLAAPAGKEIYQGTCIACHGANGKGVLPGVPDFTSAKSPLKAPDAVVLKRIKQGYQSPGSPMAMPPKGGSPSLTDADLKAVLAYLRKSFER
ncbi:MAG: cytochrome c [Betaproteobacteria bacterium]|nr:MAG: cytochrome c [Betaproteobacteria bacterium]